MSSANCEVRAGSPPLPARLRRLTAPEYVNTIQSLFGSATSLPSIEFPPDAALGTFHNGAAFLRVTDLLASALADMAQQTALRVTENLPQLMGCDPVQGDELVCVAGFLRSLAERAYRRPLSAAEQERLMGVYQLGRSGADVWSGVALALELVLQSPNLIYRTELGPAESLDASVSLTAYELASELSYLVTLGPPDAELARAAAAGELSDPASREAQARRLLAQPAARSAMAEFVTEWLDIGKLPAQSKDAAMFPGFSPEAARAMQGQTQQLFTSVVFDGDGKLRSLLVGGLLLEPSVLAAQAGSQWSSPTHRGKLIRNQLLCQQVPPPPPGLIVTVPPATPGVTTRQRMITHASDPACSGCHTQMDPLGFAFEHYDAVGAYRSSEGGLVIDSSGEVTGGGDADGPFADAPALIQRLVESRTVRTCFAEQWTTFAIGSQVDDNVHCALRAAFDQFADDSLSLSDLLVAVVRSDAFSKRHVP